MDNKLNIFITIISIASSYGLNHDVKPASECKLAHLKNCIDDKCTVGISVINKCPINHPDQETKNRCESFNDSDLRENTFLFRPVTNKLENVTYWNVYCVWCNHRNITWENFAFWTLQAYHVLIEDEFGNESKPVKISESNSFVSDVDLVVIEKMKVQNETKLISEFHDRVRRVMPLRYLPSDLRNSSFEFCSLQKNDESGQFQVENDTMVFLPAPEHFSCAEKKFCSGRKIPQPDSCVYFDRDEVPCSINQFLIKNIDFVHYEGKIIRHDGKIFDKDAYVTLSEDLIFLCGPTNITNKTILNVVNKLFEYMEFNSVIFLFIFLIIKTSKKTFRSLPKLVLYSYSVALLNLYLYRIFHSLLMEQYGVVLKVYVVIYTLLSYGFWACIISYEYWYVISAALKVQKPSIEMRRYRIYGVIGWILPALLLCAVYLSLTEEDKTSNCFTIPDHKNINIAESFSDVALALHVFLVLLSYVIFFVLIPVLGVQGWYFIRLVDERRKMARRQAEGNSNATRQVSELDYLFIFSKIAYLMGIHWMMIFITFPLSFFIDVEVLSCLISVLFSCQGTFIFFAFGYKNVRSIGIL